MRARRKSAVAMNVSAAVLAAAAAGALVHLLYSAYCAWTWGKFNLVDYGKYTNAIWNAGHGNGFKTCLTDSYLYTHLSFSLALLGPLFRLWDHPLLLGVAQWAMLAAGAGLLAAVARRRRLAPVAAAAVLFFFVDYRFTQSAMLAQFHGVSAYFLLVPWLYYCLSFRKPFAWLPVLLILGLREDAFLVVLPMVLYFAVRDRWRAGYLAAAAGLAYVALAVLAIYPWINGISIFERRESHVGAARILALFRDGLGVRSYGLLRMLPPLLVCAGRGAWPALIFPSVAFLTAFFSGYPTQHAIGGHYSAPVMACLGCGVLEGFVRRAAAGGGRPGRDGSAGTAVRALLLAVATLAVHLESGFILFGGKAHGVYQAPSLQGRAAYAASRHLPARGNLVTSDALIGFCCNREDVINWPRYDPPRHRLDVVFADIYSLEEIAGGRLLRMVRDGELGVSYMDADVVILERGHETTANRRLLETLPLGPIALAGTARHAGRDLLSAGGERVRHWCGDGARAPVTLSYGGSRPLSPGRYEAVLTYRAERPRRVCRGTWGTLSVHRLNDQGPPLAQAELAHLVTPEGRTETQTLAFDVAAAGDIEVRVTGGDAPLWLYSAAFVPAAPGAAPASPYVDTASPGARAQTPRSGAPFGSSRRNPVSPERVVELLHMGSPPRLARRARPARAPTEVRPPNQGARQGDASGGAALYTPCISPGSPGRSSRRRW